MKTNAADYQQTLRSTATYGNNGLNVAEIAKVMTVNGYNYTCQLIIKNVSVECQCALDLNVSAGDFVIVLFLDNNSKQLLSYIRSNTGVATMTQDSVQHQISNGIIIAKVKEG